VIDAVVSISSLDDAFSENFFKKNFKKIIKKILKNVVSRPKNMVSERDQRFFAVVSPQMDSGNIDTRKMQAFA